MLRPFNCLPRAVKLTSVFFLLCGLSFGQSPAEVAAIKKDVASVEGAVSEAIGAAVPGWGYFPNAKGAYLDGYGIVVTAEVALEPPLNPFTVQKTPEEVRKVTTQRRKDIEEKLTNLLKQKTASVEALAPNESVAIIINILNTNPAYVPDMPSQLVFSAKKQDSAHPISRTY